LKDARKLVAQVRNLDDQLAQSELFKLLESEENDVTAYAYIHQPVSNPDPEEGASLNERFFVKISEERARLPGFLFGKANDPTFEHWVQPDVKSNSIRGANEDYIDIVVDRDALCFELDIRSEVADNLLASPAGRRPEPNWQRALIDLIGKANSPDGIESRAELDGHLQDWIAEHWADLGPSRDSVRKMANKIAQALNLPHEIEAIDHAE